MAGSRTARLEKLSIASRYGLAVLIAAFALLLRQFLSPLFGPNYPYFTVWAAVIFSVWYCGTGPSVVTALTSVLGVWYWFLPPGNTFALQDPKIEISGIVGSLVLSSFIIAIGEANHRSRRRLERGIVERLHTEKELIAANAKFRAVFDQTSVFAGILTLDGTVIDANRLSLEACGYRAEEVLGRPFWQTGWWRASQELQAKIREATAQAAQGTPYREVLAYLCADGTERLAEVAIDPIRDDQGQIIFLHPTGIDITDLKRAEEALRKSHLDLEQKVEERTQALAASLATLELQIEVRKKTEQQLRQLSARVLRLQDEERRRIARDLHDSTGQTLSILKMNLMSLGAMVAGNPNAAGLLSDLSALAEQAVQEIRSTSYLLHPPLLEELGFRPAAEWYVAGFSKRSGIASKLEFSSLRLIEEAELALFRILQESLTNVLRHSGSKAVEIRFVPDGENALLSIKDYGKGIPSDKLDNFRETAAGIGVGLGGMKQRVRQLGGHLKIESDETGTCVMVTLPLATAERVATKEDSATAASGS